MAVFSKNETWHQVYGELKDLARNQLNAGSPKSITPTVLVHETYLKLLAAKEINVKDKGHFLGLCCHVMRQVLVQNYREKAALKRGGHLVLTTLEENLPQGWHGEVDVLALDEALEQLGAHDGELGHLVELRFYGGLTVAEIAEALAIHPRTVERRWLKAKLLLFDILNG